jgi:hypothetical protein
LKKEGKTKSLLDREKGVSAYKSAKIFSRPNSSITTVKPENVPDRLIHPKQFHWANTDFWTEPKKVTAIFFCCVLLKQCVHLDYSVTKKMFNSETEDDAREGTGDCAV